MLLVFLKVCGADVKSVINIVLDRESPSPIVTRRICEEGCRQLVAIDLHVTDHSLHSHVFLYLFLHVTMRLLRFHALSTCVYHRTLQLLFGLKGVSKPSQTICVQNLIRRLRPHHPALRSYSFGP